MESAKVYAYGLSAISELQVLNLQILEDQAVIQHHSSIKMEAQNVHDSYAYLQSDLVVASDKKEGFIGATHASSRKTKNFEATYILRG